MTKPLTKPDRRVKMLMSEAHALIQHAAISGHRAPFNRRKGVPLEGAIPRHAMLNLVKLGHIKLEVYARNWRVIELLTGPAAGHRTQECPFSPIPYRVLQNKGKSE
jgi:hypothetical protein